jgi:hypothetical protein
MLLAGGSALGLSLEMFAEAQAKEARFLTAAQFTILDDVAETIIPATDTPGARGAGVPQAFDALLLNWGSEQHRAEFVALLNDFDRLALSQEGSIFTALAPEKKTAFLERYEIATFPKQWSYNAILIGGAKPSSDPPYVKFKELVVTLYYLSEVGATQELRYEHDPGVWDPAMEVTPETRAWAAPV